MDKYWTTGMRNGNFVIASNYVTTNISGIHVQSDVAIRINQDGLMKLPNDINIWGNMYSNKDIEREGSSIFKTI